MLSASISLDHRKRDVDTWVSPPNAFLLTSYADFFMPSPPPAIMQSMLLLPAWATASVVNR